MKKQCTDLFLHHIGDGFDSAQHFNMSVCTICCPYVVFGKLQIALLLSGYLGAHDGQYLYLKIY